MLRWASMGKCTGSTGRSHWRSCHPGRRNRRRSTTRIGTLPTIVGKSEWITHPDNVDSARANANRASKAIRQSKPVRARNGMDDRSSFRASLRHRFGVNHGNISALTRREVSSDGRIRVRRRHACRIPFLDGEEWRDSRDGGRALSDACMENWDHLYSSTGDGRVRQGHSDSRATSHRLVRGRLPPPPTPEHVHVNHKDPDRSNNHVSNLEWSTIRKICCIPTPPMQRGSNAGRLAKPVRGRRRDSDEWTVYPGVLARQHGGTGDPPG